MACCEGTNVFSAGPGRVVAIEDETAIPVAFAVDGDVETFNNLMAIATSVGIQAQGGFQFMHALREFIYVYVFTERVGEIVVNGLAFPGDCDNLGPQAGAQMDCGVDADTGLERVLQWYECNRITSRAEPIVISLGSSVAYDAFLVSMKADVADASTGIAQFSMRFNYVPNISDDDDFCFSIDESCLEPPCEADEEEE